MQGLEGVEILLEQQDESYIWQTLDSEFSDSLGSYKFDGLAAGRYRITFVKPPGLDYTIRQASGLPDCYHEFTCEERDNAGDVDSSYWDAWYYDSDASAVIVQLEAGEVRSDIDGGFIGTPAEPPVGNLTIIADDFIVTSEADEDDPNKTTIPSCGCEFNLSVDGLNQVAKEGVLTLEFPTDTIEVRDLSGNVIESNSEIDPDFLSSFVVVGLTEAVSGTIDLRYSGSAGDQILDSIAFNVPQRDFDIDLRVAAFIPLSKGFEVDWVNLPPVNTHMEDINWIYDLGSITNPRPAYGTNDRENPGDPGTSKIAVNATVSTASITDFENAGPFFGVEDSTTYNVLVNQQGSATPVADGSTLQEISQTPNITETLTDLANNRSQVQIVASAGYPFLPAWTTPNIDFDVTFIMFVLADCSVEVTFHGWRNDFPAYEVLVNGNVVHGYTAPGHSGPGPINLNTWTNFSGSIVIAHPASEEDE